MDPRIKQDCVVALTPAVECWKSFLKEFDGDIVAFMVKVRTESMSASENFASHCRRVFYSPTSSLRRAFEIALGDPEYQTLVYELLPDFRRKTILGQWGTQRVAVLFSDDAYRKTIADTSWRSVSAEDLIESFKPWAFYVALHDFTDPTGMNRSLTGLYVGFEYHHDEVRLFCQTVGRGRFDPVDYHEFELPLNSTLGESVDNWKYDMPYGTLLQEELSKKGQVASDDYEPMKKRYAGIVGAIAFSVAVRLFLRPNEQLVRYLDYEIGEFLAEPDENNGSELERYEVNLDYRKVNDLLHRTIMPVCTVVD